MPVPKSLRPWPRVTRFRSRPAACVAAVIAVAAIAGVASIAAAPAAVLGTASPRAALRVADAPPAAVAPCLPLTPRNPDGNYIVPGVRGAIVYRRIGNGTAATELMLDAYVQPGGGGPRPGVVVIHGGGWQRGSRAAFTGQFLELLTRAGYNWVAVDYRLGPLADHDRAVDDVQAAVAFVRCHARELAIDPARIVLFGEDTGAQLAALLASRGVSGVRAMVLVGGFYDLHATADTWIPRGSPAGLVLRASPVHRVRAGMPSTLLVRGEGDGETPLTQVRRYCAALHAVRAACDIINVAGAGHRAENWWPSQWGYKAQVADWLSRTLSFTAPPSPPPTPSAASSAAAGLHKDIVYSPAHDLKLDAYIPSVQRTGTSPEPVRPEPFPAVIIAHGGGWEAGDKVTYVTPLFELLAKAGFAWFSIDYRLTPDVQHPAQLDDLRDAIRFIRANATRFNIDPARIALLGESASGQMVMQVAATNTAATLNANTTDTSSTAVAAVVSFYGVYDFEAMVEAAPAPPRSLLWRLFRLPTLDPESRAVLRAHSPIHHVRPGMPPVLLIHGTNERLWTQGQAIDRILTDRGIPHELIPLEGAPHGLENWEGHAPWMHYKPHLIKWLRDNLDANIPAR